jgi:peptide/nickel transport system permease protein
MAASASAASPTPVGTRVPRGRISELWHDKTAAIGLAFILLIVLLALFAPLIAPYDPAAQSIMARLISAATSCPASSGVRGRR